MRGELNSYQGQITSIYLFRWYQKEGKIKVRNGKDFYAGLLFIFFGLLALLEARNYEMGTSRDMGPGYFPIVLGGSMVLFGLAITLRGLRWSGEAVKLRSLRPLLLVCAGVLAFAFLVQPFGLLLAVLALVFISCLGGWEFRLREVAALSFVLAALVVGVFVYALGLPFNIFWTR